MVKVYVLIINQSCGCYSSQCLFRFLVFCQFVQKRRQIVKDDIIIWQVMIYDQGISDLYVFVILTYLYVVKSIFSSLILI